MIQLRFVFILGLSVLLLQNAEAQEKKNLKDRLYFGGNFGLEFGTVTSVQLSPQVGYKITDKLISGIGVTYIYYKFEDTYYHYKLETNIYGGDIFTKYLITDNLFAHVEYESLNLEVLEGTYIEPRVVRKWVPAMFVGGGYRQPMGERSSLQLLVLYDIIQDINSPYRNNNPVIRIGFGFGF